LDVRLFKFLVFIGADGVLALLYFVSSEFSRYVPHYDVVHYAHLLLMISVPLLIALPEDNWIWLVEESPRTRKVALRTKAVKHLHLSMLYLFLMNFPIFIFCVALMQLYHPYDFPLNRSFIATKVFIAAAFLYGLYSAWKNNVNVRKHESLFAVAWDRRSLFYEIFVGFKVSREPYFFYSGFGLIGGILLFLGAVAAPPMYLHFVGPLSSEYDQEKHVVLTVVFHLLLVSGVWSTTMYMFFQLFFSRSLDRWERESKDRSKNH
jgi:hypothetical protein